MLETLNREWSTLTVAAERHDLTSLDRLHAGHRFEWVLPGHGDVHHAPAAEMADRLAALVARGRRPR